MYELKLGMSLQYFELAGESGKKICTVNHEFLRLLDEMKENGFYSIEFGICRVRNQADEDAAFPLIKQGVEEVQKRGIFLNSVHLPYNCNWLSVTEPDEKERKQNVKNMVKNCSYFKGCMPRYFVLHPSNRPEPHLRDVGLRQLVKSLRELHELTGAHFLVENMTNYGLLNVSQEALPVLYQLPELDMVVDVNHPLFETPEHYIRTVGSRVKSLHISDRDAEKECHYMPGEGVLNWMEIISALEEVGYDGVFNYELRLSHGYTPTMIRKNFDELFAKYNAMKK